jgi:hypothetical protein
MQSFTIHTLIDVTETRAFKHQDGTELAKLQQQNFMTMLQTIGLRANPMFNTSPCVEHIDLSTCFFGTAYKGTHRVWSFKFDIEYDSAFVDAVGNEVGLLLSDMHYVPIITDLTETVTTRLAVFDTNSTEFRNTVVYTGS